VPADITREFPSNFSTTPWVIRYGLPTVTAYDFTSTSPDSAHAYDAGHKGVLVTWAAKYIGGQWKADYGSQPFGAGVAGDGTPYNPKPTYTNGDSCWYYGLGAAYPTSGCDHFGISFGAGVAYGKITYHWKVPDPSNVGQLKNANLEASIPPSPGLTLNPPVAGQMPVVHAVAEAPENPEPQFGPAYWLKTTTLYGQQDAILDNLQKANVKKAKSHKTVSWTLVQQAPAGQMGEKAEMEDDPIPAGAVQVTKQYEYFQFGSPKNATKVNGFNPNVAYDSETHETLCDIYLTQADAAAGTNAMDGCVKPRTGSYWVQDPLNGAVLVKGGNQGTYIGAHINAYNVQ
jgi:hypothetical protein